MVEKKEKKEEKKIKLGNKDVTKKEATEKTRALAKGLGKNTSTPPPLLPGMPGMGPLGKAAHEYLDLKDSIERDKDMLTGEVSDNLIREFLKVSKEKITIDGRIVSLNHIEKEVIYVRTVQ